MTFRKAKKEDIPAIASIYEAIHTAEENGKLTTGWVRTVYPTEGTAADALQREDLFVEEDEGKIVGAAIINQQQVDCYKQGSWNYDAPDQEVMVLHTLVIDPAVSGKGYGKAFALYYEEYAISNGCHYLRIDTQEKNRGARVLYKKLGYQEIGTVPCKFNGIPSVQLVLLEKKLDA